MPRDARRRRWAVLALAALLALAAGWGTGRYFGVGEEPDEAPAQAVITPPPAATPTATGAGSDSPTAATESGSGTSAPEEAPAEVLHRPRPDFTLPDLDGRQRRPDEWNGKVLVVNFWATWCAPCRDEIPLLIELERDRPGVRVIGIAVDHPDAVRAFAKELGIGYPILFDDLRGTTMRRYGNRIGALPFTVVTDREGVVAYVRLGELEPGELERITDALL